ncbi:MAG: NAD-dependent deacylase [Flavobacteriaceae bacterium]|nr:NAD-dependent deacylase [Flavobacteriaceae bacterium]
MKNLVVLTGAGMSAESGLKTFRDEDGLWEGHDVLQVATPEGFAKNPELVLEFYNQRRKQLKSAQPNRAHYELAKLDRHFNVNIITQNVDDLHERAGSENVLHLHGELFKVRSTGNPRDIKKWEDDLCIGDKCEKGYQLRPHVVWFGEAVPMMDRAIKVCEKADIVLVIGTSLQVYPAASLMHYAKNEAHCYYIDPKPSIQSNSRITVIPKTATEGMKEFLNMIEFN